MTLSNFCNPKIPGLGCRQSWDSGLAKTTGILGSQDLGSQDCNPYPRCLTYQKNCKW